MKNKAFTLIELLVVVLIIGILAAIALPKYEKAVVKARFAEALINLKAIADAQKVCYLEKGEVCSFEEMAITPPGVLTIDTSGSQTENFSYRAQIEDSNGNKIWSQALYFKEDVCICYLQTGEMVFSADGEADCNTDPTFNYKGILPIREVPYDDCACC